MSAHASQALSTLTVPIRKIYLNSKGTKDGPLGPPTWGFGVLTPVWGVLT